MSPRLSIAEQNDLLRATFLTGKVVLTAGIASLCDDVRESILSKVRAFGEFMPDNDPHGEHDFGAFEKHGVGTIVWKIDYYDTDYRYRSPDPANPALTRRVLTIMLADEY